MTDRRGRAGSSSMISSSVMAFISSSVYPRYVNSFLRRVSTRPARFRNFLRAAFARPPIFFAMPITSDDASPSTASAGETSVRPCGRAGRQNPPWTVCPHVGATRLRGDGRVEGRRRRSEEPRGKRTERGPVERCVRAPGRSPSRSRHSEGADRRRARDVGGSANDRSAKSHGRGVGSAGSFPSEHPDPHADLFGGEFRFQLDDRVLAVPPDERVHLRDLHLEEVLEGLLDLVSCRLTTHEELEPVPVLQILSGRALQHVECFLCDIRMEENLVRLHGDQLRSTSRAPSLNIVSRPGSPPGARTSALNPAGLTTSTPGRFPKSRRTFAGSFTTTSRLRGCR